MKSVLSAYACNTFGINRNSSFMSYTVLGISSGIGVSLYPFKSHLIGNVEPRAIFHSPGEKQWNANFPDVPLYRDLENTNQQVNVIIGSPDCGSGSVLRLSVAKEYGDIKVNKSLNLFVKGIKMYKPDFLYFENLPGMFKSLSKERLQKKFSKYNLIFHEAPVSMWGNSQIHRKRLVIIGIRKDIDSQYLRLFRLPDRRELNRTCYELYGDLDELSSFNDCVDIGHIREPMFNVVTVFSKFKCTVAECMGYWIDHPKQKRWEVKGRRFSNAPGVYRNRRNDYPATARKANRQFDHNGLMLTPRQLARIQGVPDDFKIYVDPDKLNYWINKGRAAVTKTPPMEISKWFFNKLNKYYANI